MSDDTRWAARYQFLEELWRGRERVVVDTELEAVLRQGGPGVAHGSHPPLRDLVDEIVPRDTVAVRVWMAVADADTARDLGRSRGGTRFVTRAQLSGVLRTEGWEVAVVDLAPFLAVRASAPEDEAPRRDNRGRFLPREGSLSGTDSVSAPGETLLRLLGTGVAERGSTVVLVVPAGEFPTAENGLSFAEVASILGQYLGGGRVYGVFAPEMAGVVRYGDDVAAEEGGPSDEGEAAEDDDMDGESGADEEADEEEVPLSYDNTLALEEPEILQFVAVAGSDLELGDGLTLIELPLGGPAEGAPEVARTPPPDPSGMRAQLAEARRQADLAAIERQQLVEQADRILSEREALEEEVAELRERLARIAGDGSDVPLPVPVIRERTETLLDLDDGVAAEEEDVARAEPYPGDRADERERLDAVLAREQGIRWHLGRALAEVAALRKRPVDELEAEVATLRAQLDAIEAAPQAGEGPLPPGAPDARARARESAMRALDRLVRKVEREGIGALELRRELMELARLLRA